MGEFDFTYWNDWNDYRDSYRYSKDKTLIKKDYVWFSEYKEVKRFNKKIKMLLNRRKNRKVYI